MKDFALKFRFTTNAPLIVGILHLATLGLVAESFAPPVAYPTERYESGWKLNPFTLKTRPTVGPQESFAKDLAIQSHYGSVEKPIVSIVNTKTRERVKLSPGETDEKTGMLLKAVFVKPSRKETYAEVVQGGETAIVRYDSAFIAQMAASQPATPAGQAQTAATGTPAGMPMPNRTANTMPPTGAAATMANNAVRPSPHTPNPYGVPNGAAANPNIPGGNVPTPMRRRLLTAPTPQPSAQPPPTSSGAPEPTSTPAP